MTRQRFKQHVLSVSLAACAFFLMACAGNDEPANRNSSGNANVAVDAAENRNAYGNANLSGEPGDQASDEFEGTAGIVSRKEFKGGPVLLREIRAAEQNGFDRVVLEFEGDAIPNYRIEYIDKPVRQCGSGNVVQLAGDGWLEVKLNPANAHTEAGRPTIADRERSFGFSVLKELEITCDFEAEVAVVLGVSSPNRYRVLNLSNPARVVVDIKHKNR